MKVCPAGQLGFGAKPQKTIAAKRETATAPYVASRNRASNIQSINDILANNFPGCRIQRGSEERTSDAVSRI